MRTQKLSRQLKKTFEDNEIDGSIEKWAADLKQRSDDTLAPLKSFLGAFPEFLEQVDETYLQADEKVKLAQRNLEVSSIELTEANKSLFQLNQTFDAMLNSLGQGFFLFGPSGHCLPVYSKACEKLMLCKPAGLTVMEVLRIPEAEHESFRDWFELIFMDKMDFEDLAALGPQIFLGTEGRTTSLEYKAVRDLNSEIQSILVIATDRTSEVQAQRKAEELQAHVTFLASALKDGEQFRKFVSESRRLFKECLDIVHAQSIPQKDLEVLVRHLHTLKGAAGSFGVIRVKDELHDIETRMRSSRDSSAIKLELEKMLPQVLNRFETILADNHEIVGDSLKKSTSTRELDLKDLVDIANAMKGFTEMKELYQQFVERLVSVPAKKIFAPFDSILQSSAKKLGKTVKPVSFEGDSIYLVPENYSDLLSSLGHVFRNIADHGIEFPEDRKSVKKDPMGQVSVEFRRIPNKPHRFQLMISDDGKGVNDDRIRAKLREIGQVAASENAEHTELLDWLFRPGFSTAKAITDMSGRGIGLDAVRASVEAIGGRVWVESSQGKGTRFFFDLPVLNEVTEEQLQSRAA